MTPGGGTGIDGVIGTKLFDQRQDADDDRAAADEHDAEDEDGGDAGAEPAIDAEDEAVGARLQALHRWRAASSLRRAFCR